MKASFLVLFSVIIALTACGGDRPAKNNQLEAPTDTSALTKDHGNLKTSIIPTSMREAQTKYFDFDSASIIEVEDPKLNQDWDIGVKFYNISSNSGVSGPGGVLVTFLEAKFDDIKKAPSTGYFHDVASLAVNPFVSGLAFLRSKGWFTYYFNQGHRIEIKDRIYVVKSTKGTFFKIKIESFSKSDGTPGDLKFNWTEIEPADEDLKEVADQVSEAVDISMEAAK